MKMIICVAKLSMRKMNTNLFAFGVLSPLKYGYICVVVVLEEEYFTTFAILQVGFNLCTFLHRKTADIRNCTFRTSTHLLQSSMRAKKDLR